MFFIYNVLLTLFLPLLVLRLLWRSRKQPAYKRHWRERFACEPLPQADIWVHAVSVGEVKIALHVVEQLQKQWRKPNILISCTTPTGRAGIAQWKQRHPEHIHYCYLPFDLRYFVNKVLHQVQPKILLVIETEVWPALIVCAHTRGVHTVLVNARMSKKSALGYRRIIRLIKPTFASFDLVLAQTRADAARLRLLGVRSCQVTGNLKFDFSVSYNVDRARQLRQQFGKRSFIFAIGSSRLGEERFLCDAISNLLDRHEQALVLWAPRHWERSEALITNQLKQFGFRVNRFSDGIFDDTSQIVLIDSFGDLMLIYALADCVFIGGTLVDTGSQNLIEPALLGKPIISGPSHFNFSFAHRKAKSSGGLLCVDTQESLNRTLLWLAGNSSARQRLGKQVQQAMQSCQGGTAKTISFLQQLNRTQ